MTTNREWLYSLDVADLAAWFDAEHVETEERALDGDTAALNAKIAELTAERDTLQGALDIAVQNESKLEAERDELKGQVFTLKGECEDLENERDKLQEQLRIGWECECRLQAERELYRSKFGKCLDYADAIHALMDDEGMA